MKTKNVRKKHSMELILVAAFGGGAMVLLGTLGLIVEMLDRDISAPPPPKTSEAMEQVTNRVRRRVQESCMRMCEEEGADGSSTTIHPQGVQKRSEPHGSLVQ